MELLRFSTEKYGAFVRIVHAPRLLNPPGSQSMKSSTRLFETLSSAPATAPNKKPALLLRYKASRLFPNPNPLVTGPPKEVAYGVLQALSVIFPSNVNGGGGYEFTHT